MMINRATGEVNFRSKLHILPHCAIDSLPAHLSHLLKGESGKPTQKDWTRHILGFHLSEHGKFEVEALSADDKRIHIVLLSHERPLNQRATPDDADRRVVHEGVIASDLAGQKEFTWGEVICRLDASSRQDWIVIAYSRESNVPLPDPKGGMHLCAHENSPENGS